MVETWDICHLKKGSSSEACVLTFPGWLYLLALQKQL